MTPKERRQILKGLLSQGAVVHREGKRGTILHFPNGAHFNVPTGTSDYKARLAMRAEIKRAGYHWPLDPPENKKKEPTVPTLYRNEAGEIMPSSVVDLQLPLETNWEAIRPILESHANDQFWTDEVYDEVKDMSGYRGVGGTGLRRLQQMLWFGGFRVDHAKANRNGFSYHWHRAPDAAWPSVFATPPTERAASLLDYRRRKTEQEAPKPSPALLAGTTGTPTPAPKPEVAPAEAVVSGTAEAVADEETGLALAEEYERRALKAEREREGAKVALDAEKRAHAETRRSLMVKNASQERVIGERDAEITRLRSLLQERAAEIREGVGADQSVLARAHKAEQMQAALQDDVADLTARLRSSEEELQQVQADSMRNLEAAARKARPVDDTWWPLEPQKGQTIEETMAGAKLFGLEVRVQARRA